MPTKTEFTLHNCNTLNVVISDSDSDEIICVHSFSPESVESFRPDSTDFFMKSSGFCTDAGNGLAEIGWLGSFGKGVWSVTFTVVKSGNGFGGSSDFTVHNVNRDEMVTLMQCLDKMKDEDDEDE